jgi:hypothetical protein
MYKAVELISSAVDQERSESRLGQKDEGAAYDDDEVVGPTPGGVLVDESTNQRTLREWRRSSVS